MNLNNLSRQKKIYDVLLVFLIVTFILTIMIPIFPFMMAFLITLILVARKSVVNLLSFGDKRFKKVYITSDNNTFDVADNRYFYFSEPDDMDGILITEEEMTPSMRDLFIIQKRQEGFEPIFMSEKMMSVAHANRIRKTNGGKHK